MTSCRRRSAQTRSSLNRLIIRSRIGTFAYKSESSTLRFRIGDIGDYRGLADFVGSPLRVKRPINWSVTASDL